MKLQPREYQQKIIESIQTNGNTLVVLPTGLGKTLIALSLMEKTTGKCLFLTPTKPLARQHTETIADVLGEVKGGSVLVTGESAPKKRAVLYNNRVISSTPQTIRNDINKGIFPKEEVSLVVFDEAHRAVGEYAYVQIAEKLPETAKIIALTASPGGDRAKIKEVLTNLRITNIEIRVPTDPDVSPYVKKMNYNWVPVELSNEYAEAKTILSTYIKKQVELLRNMGIRPQIISKRAFLALRPRILKIKHPMRYRLIYLYTCLLHALHLQELLETQGKVPVFKYLEKLSKSDSKSAITVSNSTEVRKIKSLLDSTDDHPKMKKLLSIVSTLKEKKLIVFVQYRDQITEIVSELTKQGHTARPFMGKRDKFTKKLQEETMDSFRKGEFAVLVASSIGEEGLDIPEVDSVIFYEPIPSEIRSIQRRGRAGRLKEGSVYVLMTKDTRDEYYFWASKKREKKMKEVLLSFQEKFRAGKPLVSKQKKKDPGQNTLNEFLK
ncbi:MAG: DEAD/DEAH box helicase family protein [bacterium]|nr:DEAD/DEAH box helicase family protein [bacterium]